MSNLPTGFSKARKTIAKTEWIVVSRNRVTGVEWTESVMATTERGAARMVAKGDWEVLSAIPEGGHGLY